MSRLNQKGDEDSIIINTYQEASNYFDNLTSLLDQTSEALNSGDLSNDSIGYRIFECIFNRSIDVHALINVYKGADEKERESMDRVMRILAGYTMKTLLMDALMDISKEI